MTFQLTLVVIACTSSVLAQARSNLNIERGVRHEVPFLVSQLLAVVGCWDRDNWFSLRVCPGKLYMLLRKAIHPKIFGYHQI